MQSIKVEDFKIIARHSGSGIPEGNIQIDDEDAALIRLLEQQARTDGRDVAVEWRDGAPLLPDDIRPLIDVLINGSSANIMVVVGSSFDVQLTITPALTREIVIPVFERRFLFNFVDGVATKSIAVTESKEYNISSDSNFRVVTPITIDAVE